MAFSLSSSDFSPLASRLSSLLSFTQDALAWYGGEYPFEMVLTTCLTHVFRHLSERLARQCVHSSSSSSSSSRGGSFWEPMLHMGRYGPSDLQPFSWRWYGSQMVQAVLLIGIPARLTSVGLILLSMLLPASVQPVSLVASSWFYAGMSCTTRTALTLYVVPLAGDVAQFLIVDQIQKARGVENGDRRQLLHLGSAGASPIP